MLVKVKLMSILLFNIVEVRLDGSNMEEQLFQTLAPEQLLK